LAHDVFIGYTVADKATADAICHRLEEAGIRCWIAPRDVGFGDWGASIVDAISDAKLVVMIFSAAASASHNVLDEIVTALDGGATVIPFRIEDIRPTGALRLRLSRLHWHDALSPPLDPHIDRLIESAKRNLPGWREADEARRQQEEQQRQAEEELQRRQQEEQRLKAEGELQRRHQEEQLRKSDEELRRLQAEEQGRCQQEAPPPKPNEEPAWKLVEPLGGPSKPFRHWLAVATVIVAAAFLLWALAFMQGGVFTPPSQQVSLKLAAPDKRALALQSSPAPAPQPAPAPALEPVLLRTLTGHTDAVLSVAFSLDGRTLASGGHDHIIKLWDFASGQLLRTLTGHTYPVYSVAFSPDGRRLASGSLDKTIKLWDSASGKLLRTLTGHNDKVMSIAFSPNGHILASGSADNTSKLWDVASGQLCAL
jgi:hypothetical protein